jgi:hypothetical protein
MKTTKYLIMALLLCGILSSAWAGNPVWEAKIKAPQVESKVPHVTSSISNINFTGPIPASAPAFDKCRKYKNKQIAGFVLLPVSVGMMAGGTYMIYKGAKNIYDATNIDLEVGVKTEVTREDKILLGVGAGLGFVGFVLFPTSLALGIKGGTNYNRDCRGGGRSLLFRPTGNGVSMALKF